MKFADNVVANGGRRRWISDDSDAAEQIWSEHYLFDDQWPSMHSFKLFMLAVIVYSSVVSPYELAFGSQEEWALPIIGYLELPVTVCFFVDMCVTFNTAVRERHGICIDRCEIAKRYWSQGWLIVDVVSWFPWDQVAKLLLLGLKHRVQDERKADTSKIQTLSRLAPCPGSACGSTPLPSQAVPCPTVTM